MNAARLIVAPARQSTFARFLDGDGPFVDVLVQHGVAMIRTARAGKVWADALVLIVCKPNNIAATASFAIDSDTPTLPISGLAIESTGSSPHCVGRSSAT